jgi:hypothetical protein
MPYKIKSAWHYTWFFFIYYNKDRILGMGKSKEGMEFMSNKESLKDKKHRIIYYLPSPSRTLSSTEVRPFNYFAYSCCPIKRTLGLKTISTHWLNKLRFGHSDHLPDSSVVLNILLNECTIILSDIKVTFIFF